ncbi:MAG: CoA transferase [Rhodospirillales bacterium]|nr:CoA transferase [Alphaproteobacteria bacterium]MBL6947484.1 CoA transferase [Rhodospirillales bacterium]
MHEFNPDDKGPLDGVRVLDMTRLIAGNMLSLQLADFGAEVIKIEPPGKGDPLRAWKDDGIDCHWKVYARNKKSLTLNLREPEAIDILLRLVEGADVLIENFRPGRLEEMGLAPDTLHLRNPKLIIARISGWGQTGPYRNRPGFGSLVEAMSGFADRNGFPDREPVLPPLALADMIAGLYGAMAVMIATREVEVKGGRGQVVDLSLLEPIFSVLGPEALTHKVTGRVKQRMGSGSNTSSPRNAYPTRDGKWVALSASIQSMAERVFRVIGREDMIDDDRFRTNPDRVKHRDQVDAILGGWIKERDQAEVLEIFEREEVTASGIYDIRDIIADSHFQGREVLVDLPDEDVGSAPMHNIIPRLSATPGTFRLPAPALGEHNAALLAELDIDANGLADLTERGVI